MGALGVDYFPAKKVKLYSVGSCPGLWDRTIIMYRCLLGYLGPTRDLYTV